jgi:integrase
MSCRHRIELPLAAWPAADRATWKDLFRAGDILDGQGAAVHWAEATRKTNRKHYARWLGWLAANDLLDVDVPPWRRVIPARVEAYARSLIDRLAPRTAASALIGLKCVVQRMRPDHDWRWLKELTNRLDRWAEPSRDSRERAVPASDIFTRVLAELERCARSPLGKRRDQLIFRDSLIVAILATCPIRLRNLAMMEIGTHLCRVGAVWHLRFDGGETKTGQPIHLVIPRELDPFLTIFLEKVRPAFPRAADDSYVWPACKGKPMAKETIYMRVMKRTRELFGVALNPHAFRTIAATFLSESSPGDALYARPLLGHRQQQTTERYYIRASQIDAARNVSIALRQIRDT